MEQKSFKLVTKYSPKGDQPAAIDELVANINADFLAPVFFSDELIIETAVIHIGNKSLTLLQRATNKASGVLKCQCRTVLVGYDIATKEPVALPKDYKEAICLYEGKTLEELSEPVD